MRAALFAALIITAGCARFRSDPIPLAGREQLPRTILARPELLRETARLVRERNVYIMPAYSALMRAADSSLRIGTISVIQKSTVPPSGDKHDYLSLAPYWWPDSTKPGGLPYIRRDGQMNPQTRIDHDGLRFGALTSAAEALALAYWFTGEERYASHAAFLLRGWFITPATRMNPNLRFAQAILGVTEGRGIGILDLRHFPRLLDAVRLIDRSPSWKGSDRSAFESWLREYLNWLRESRNGRDERAEKNNHGTLFDMQAASLAIFLGDSAYAREMLNESAVSRVDSQIAGGGAQQLELDRTRPIHYSLFNLDAFTQLAEMSRHTGANLWDYRNAEGGSIPAALRFIAPYADGTRKWTKPDIVPIARDDAAVALRRAGTVLGDSGFANAAVRAASVRGVASRELIFYPGVPVTSLANFDSLSARALTFARTRVRSAAASLDPSNGYPRFTGPDGSWIQRPYNQWTSGFFAGTLWYLFALDKTAEWKALAERWTGGIEPAKSILTTHDLGFMVFNSFGHGYLLTGNRGYRDVVVEASRSLATRFNPRVGAIQSWNTYNGNDARRTWKYPVIVDNLMNLEMLFRSAEWGESRWRRIAEEHALTSARAHVRGDGSTPHVALFDPESGSLERTVTWQGFSDSSTWARGQAWAIHGFAAAYGNTRNRRLLDAAERTADWFLANVPPDGVPYWDLRHPSIPEVERDASAAAIAASGLLDLARHSNEGRARIYREAAERMLRTLASRYLTQGTSAASILAHSVGGKPQNAEVDVGLVYADYYFVEALLRHRGMFIP